jgi:CheY-like chemotaxis protein
MQRTFRTLIVHDAPNEAALLAGALRLGSQIHAETVGTLDAAISRARDEAFHAVFISIILADPRRGGTAELKKRISAPVIFVVPAVPAAGTFHLEPWEWVAAPYLAVEVQRALAVANRLHVLENKLTQTQRKAREEEGFADKGRVAVRAAEDMEKLLGQLEGDLGLLRETVPSGFHEKLGEIERTAVRLERVCHQLLGRAVSPVLTTGSPTNGPKPVQLNRSANTILIVDDEESIRELSACVVRQAGWNAVTARDGEEALLRFQAEPNRFSAAVVDLSLPRLTGLEVVSGIRAMRPGLPVILISGHGDESLACDPRLALNGMLRKPFSTDALKAALSRSLKSEVVRPAAV